MAEHKVDVLVIGGGMNCEEAVLPAVFQQRRLGNVGQVSVVSLNSGIISRLREAFPDEEFVGVPDPATTPADRNVPTAYKDCLAELGESGLVYVTTPDHLHTQMVLDSIEAGCDVVCMKPLCLKVDEAHAIQAAARQRGVYVYTDYHKRHDRAIRLARRRYRAGDLGEMLHGHAWIEERREMPLHTFARWCEQSSPFEYNGVHHAEPKSGV